MKRTQFQSLVQEDFTSSRVTKPGSSVWLVSKICKEESTNERIAICNIMYLNKTEASWQPIKAACVEESAYGPFRLRIWAKNMYFALDIYSQAKQHVILVWFWLLQNTSRVLLSLARESSRCHFEMFLPLGSSYYLVVIFLSENVNTNHCNEL